MKLGGVLVNSTLIETTFHILIGKCLFSSFSILFFLNKFVINVFMSSNDKDKNK